MGECCPYLELYLPTQFYITFAVVVAFFCASLTSFKVNLPRGGMMLVAIPWFFLNTGTFILLLANGGQMCPWQLICVISHLLVLTSIPFWGWVIARGLKNELVFGKTKG